MSKPADYFQGLDGLRAVSIFLVIIHHIGLFFSYWPFQSDSELTKVSGRIVYLGFLGVDLFFVISGFLIAGLLLEDISGPLRLKRFYVRRAFKILPQYFTAVLAGIVLAVFVFKTKCSLGMGLSYLFMVQNYINPPLTIVAHLWSIAVEEHFYIFLPLIFWVVWAMFKDQAGRKWALLVIFLLLIIAGNWLRSVGLAGASSWNPLDWQATHLRFDALVFGCLLRLIFPLFEEKLKQDKILPIILFLISAGLFMCVFYYYHKLRWCDYTTVYMACGLLVIAVVGGCWPLTRILETPVLRYVGKNSYGIYIWHYILIFFFVNYYIAIKSLWVIAGYVAASLCAGIISTVTIERFFLDARKRIMP